MLAVTLFPSYMLLMCDNIICNFFLSMRMILIDSLNGVKFKEYV